MAEKDCKVLKLDKNNYVAWKWQFKNVLRMKGLAHVTDVKKDIKPDEDAQSLALLGSALSEEHILKIIDCDSFHKAWASLEGCFENKTAYEPQALYRRLNNFKITSASEVSSGISEIRGIIAQLKNLEETVSDNMIIGSILNALPSSFNIFTTVWKNSANKDVDGLVKMLMAEATEQSISNDDDAKAFAMKYKGKARVGKDQCRYCKETGHWIKDCPNLKTPYDPNRGKNKQVAKKEDSPTESELAFVTTTSYNTLDEQVWVADSGCTNHMSPYKHLFSSLKTLSNGSIQMADQSSSIKIEGVGSVDTDEVPLNNVLYSPKLGQNLFSIPAATQEGITHVGLEDRMVFFKGDTKLFTAYLVNNLFLIRFKTNKLPMAISNIATVKEWHSRLIHVPVNIIEHMKKNSIVEGLDIVCESPEKCEDCIKNKCTRSSHPSRTSIKSTTAGQVLHINTAGPCNITSVGGSKYIVLCKDEASGFRQAVFVDTKDKIPNKVKEIISRTTLDTGNEVLKIVSDNGSEFTNRELKQFFEKRGIIHEVSATYTPQQNGFIERDIRTIKEAARTLLNEAKLDKMFWAEAVGCAVYTSNRVVRSLQEVKTPYEKYFKVKPNVKHLRRFGETAIIRKPTQTIKSWDEHGTTAIFVGYTSRTNTYRFLKDNKLVISCDCVFPNKRSAESKTGSSSIQSEEEFWIPTDQNTINNQVSSDVPSDYEGEDTQDIYQSPSNSANDDITPTQPLAQDNVQELIEIDSIPEQPSTSSYTTLSNFPRLVERFKNEEIKIAQKGVTYKIKLGDLKFSSDTGRWRNGITGHFVKNETLQEIQDHLYRKSRANIATTSLTYDMSVPKNYYEATISEYKEEWMAAMNDEMKSLVKNNVFSKVPKENVTKKPVGSRWVYTIKYKHDGSIEKFKARVVAKGYNQRYGIDYLETYCSVVSIMSTRLLLNYAAVKRLHIRQFDIKTAFLYAELKEETFLDIPEGYTEPGIVWQLNRSLYGLKQSPRMWNECFSKFMRESGLKMSVYDNSIFYRLDPIMIVIVYVDDGLIFSEQTADVKIFLDKLKMKFEMREMDVNVYRGLEIEQLEDGIFVHQRKYTEKILEMFRMSNSKPINNPISLCEGTNEDGTLDPDTPFMNAVGSLAYLADTTRPDIAFAVNQLARKMASPSKNDWIRTKHIFRYLRGTVGVGIKYNYDSSNMNLVSYSDSSFADDAQTAKSTTGYIIMFNNAVFHWKTQLQQHVTLSSTEAEVIALCALSKELAWIRRLMIELQMLKSEPSILKCDNQSALKIVKSEKATARTRHLRAQDAYVREQIELGELDISYVKAADQLADILTKCVATGKFTINRDRILTLNGINW